MSIDGFVRPKAKAWTKEGLLDHIIALVVCEDKVRVRIQSQSHSD
jgi:hypothetical protein